MYNNIIMRRVFSADFLVGKTIGKYKIEKILGTGGMGVVYYGIHTKLNRKVAIKVIIPNLDDEGYQKRFQKEARILAEFKHPNIVEIYDYDITEWGQPYYVMEYLEGESLEEKLMRHTKGFDIDTFCSYIKQITSALSYAHKKGVIHRDLKPSNIFIANIEGKEVIKLLDFGIAKTFMDKIAEESLTSASQIIGTPLYLAPEQAWKWEIGPYTDIYALALISAEMLTGMAVRAGKSLGEIMGEEIRKPLILSERYSKKFPVDLLRVLEKATHPVPSKRYNNAEEFGVDLCNAFSGNKIFKKSFPEPEKTEKINATIVKTVSHSSKSKFKNIGLRKYLYVFFILFLLLSGVFFIFKDVEEGGKIEYLKLIKSLPVPINVGEIVGETEKGLIVTGVNSYYILNFNKSSVPASIPLRYGEYILGHSNNGELYTYFEGAIYKHNLSTKKIEIYAKGIPNGKLMRISRTGKFFAEFVGEDLLLFDLTNKKRYSLGKYGGIDEHNTNIALTEKYLGFIGKRRLIIYKLPEKKAVFEKLFSEIIGEPVLKVDDETALVGASGWTDDVYIFDLKNKKEFKITLPGKTFDLTFIPDYPTLVIAKEGGIALVRGNKILKLHESPDSDYQSIFISTSGITVYDSKKGNISLFSYKEFPYLFKRKVSKKELWAVIGWKDKIFAGGRDGILYEVGLKSKKIKKLFKHNNGITYIGIKKGYLITASDDRTIGIFTLPEAKLIMRSKTHSYLINYLYFPNRGDNTFWSSSSDGSIKKLTIPELEEKETVKLKKEKYSFSAFIKMDNRIYAGTWNNKFVIIEKLNSKWHVKKVFNVKSKAIYRLIYSPKENFIIGIGVYPSYIYLYDLKDERFYYIENENTEFIWGDFYNDDSFLLYGRNVIAKYNIKRGEKLKYIASRLFNTDLGILNSGNLMEKRGILIVGNERGEIIGINIGEIKFPMKITGYFTTIENSITFE